MSAPQFVRWCKKLGLAPEIYEERYPHPYIILWYEGKKRASLTGIPDYPEPEKGYLDQDADLMLGFEVLDEIQEQREQEQEKRDELKKQAADLLSYQ